MLNRLSTLAALTAAALCLAPVASADSLFKSAAKPDALLPVDEAFQFEGASRKGTEIRLDWVIAPGYYLYGHTLKITADGVGRNGFSGPLLGRGEPVSDAEFGQVEVYRKTMQARLTLPADGKVPRSLRVRYQGCADIGVCYPPQTRIVAIK